VRPIVALLVLLALVTTSACTRDTGAAEFGTARPASGPLPRIEGPTLQGGSFGPTEYRGHVTVVNVWATWCSPCRREQPALQAVWERARREGVVMVGINYNDDAAAARDWIRAYDVRYPSVSDPDGAAADDFGFPGLPATYVADATGELRYRFYGEVTQGALDRILAELEPTSA
jgi:cytochrome c biogenesis protein CcmG, thiol:disulfide interchange protein DsbE